MTDYKSFIAEPMAQFESIMRRGVADTDMRAELLEWARVWVTAYAEVTGKDGGHGLIKYFLQDGNEAELWAVRSKCFVAGPWNTGGEDDEPRPEEETMWVRRWPGTEMGYAICAYVEFDGECWEYHIFPMKDGYPENLRGPRLGGHADSPEEARAAADQVLRDAQVRLL